MLLHLTKKWRWPIPVAVSLLWTFSIGIVSEGLSRLVEHPWQRLGTNSVTTADAIVVLSGGRHLSPGTAKVIEWHDPDRFLAGVELFKAGKAPRLLFTGGNSPFRPELPPEGSIYIKEAIALGIPSNAMTTTPPVVNTAEEALAIRKILSKTDTSHTPKILLVTSAFHMKRAKKLFERQGLNVQPFPVDFKSRNNFWRATLISPYSWLPSASSLTSSSRSLREILGRTIYRSW